MQAGHLKVTPPRECANKFAPAGGRPLGCSHAPCSSKSRSFRGVGALPPVEWPLPETTYSLSALPELRTAASTLAGCALTVGNFDGVHRGHQRIVQRLAREAASDAKRVALTFEPHPVRFFRPDAAPFRLTTPPQKLLLLRHYGIHAPVTLQFDRDLSNLEPEAFVRDVLAGIFAPSLVVVGYDFNFGKNRRGNPELLLKELADLGIRGAVQTAVTDDEIVISSTRLRQAVRAGDVGLARRLLARPYALLGRVVEGAGRGRALGFPTANLSPLNELLPAFGVYASILEVADERWRSITNLGVRPTFGGGDVTAETFVLDERAPDDLQLYGRGVAVHLIEHLREERKFPSPAALVAQIEQDIERCRAILEAEAGGDIVPQSGL
jgi:riboflavin kinase/FMN adenylyltransferase